jgi:hypothetical protein
VSAIGHYLESEGIATASISLVREHTVAVRPPRALWVPFPLGRPLGAAHDAAFQRRVLLALLDLFSRSSGPILEDFPEDAPPDAVVQSEDAQGESCPISFDSPAPGESGDLMELLLAEIAQLAPWQAVAARRRRGSAFGLARKSPAELARMLVAFASAQSTVAADWQIIKLAVDDLRTYYEEAASAQPAALPSDELMVWFYRRTAAGRVILDLRRLGLMHAESSVRQIADRMLIPRQVLNLIESPP